MTTPDFSFKKINEAVLPCSVCLTDDLYAVAYLKTQDQNVLEC